MIPSIVLVVIALLSATLSAELAAQRYPTPDGASNSGLRPQIEMRSPTELPFRAVVRLDVEPSIQPVLIQESRPSLARHLVIGAVLGGVAGYAIARERTSSNSGDSMIPGGLGYAFGATTGALAGAAAGALVYLARVHEGGTAKRARSFSL